MNVQHNATFAVYVSVRLERKTREKDFLFGIRALHVAKYAGTCSLEMYKVSVPLLAMWKSRRGDDGCGSDDVLSALT
jgi:hypothetical protein